MDKKINLNKNIKKFLALFLIACITLAGCSSTSEVLDSEEVKKVLSQAGGQESGAEEYQDADSGNTDGNLEVHFIDVGQGSSTLIESNGHFMLVDGGDSKYASRVVSYLKDESVKSLDYVIATHYDADHLNGIVGVLSSYDADVVIAPDYEAESKVYKSFLNVLDENDIDMTYPETGRKYEIGSAEFTILAPNDTHYDDANDYSVAIKLTNGKNSFIMTGDAEIESEYEMLETGIDLSCDVYLAGHHGSKYSSSQAFMQAMRPKSIVISAGKDNKYGHPSEEALARFNAMGCDIYRTDKQGDIIAVSNGKKIKFNTIRASGDSKSTGGSKSNNTKNNTSGEYIGNVNSKKFHNRDCSSLPDKENRVYFDTVKEAEKAGYGACGICCPE